MKYCKIKISKTPYFLAADTLYLGRKTMLHYLKEKEKLYW
jgi:hypothetical protein